ncbi:MAG TPA: GNAT family N-acetyltransferase [Candidatus Limnocylindrales bacterium]|jgi:GNAT superfamily N-acetyltransferase
MAAKAKSATPVSVDTLKRERAGTYRTADGRFTVESTSSGWLLLDGEQTDDLGLPLTRGPFATLDGAKAAIEPARSGPAPTSDLGKRASSAPKRSGTASKSSDGPTALRASTGAGTPRAAPPPVRKAPPRAKPGVVIRELRTVDGDALRALWRECGFGSLGDDDKSLARLARRNPGLVLVAAEGSRVVGSALGAWDGRRGWIYHVATAKSHRRQGIASRLIAEIETGLRSLGCPKVNVLVRDDADGGHELWQALGYTAGVSRQFGKQLEG